MKRRLLLLAVMGGALMLVVGVLPALPKVGRGPFSEKAFARPELRITSANVPLREALSLLPNGRAWSDFLEEHGPQTEVYLDPRSGTPSGIELSDPLIPGKGNHLSTEDVGRALGRPVKSISAETVGDLVKKFIQRNKAALGVDVTQLGEARATQISSDLWQVEIPQRVNGVPVRFGRMIATISHGNLVLLGTEVWDNVRIVTHPAIDSHRAEQIAFEYLGGRSEEDRKWREPLLEVIPVTPAGRETAYRAGGRIGGGYGHQLIWSMGIENPSDPGQWEILIDAKTGEVIAFTDTTYEATRKIKGGVYPLTNTGVCPSADRCGVMQPSTPMSFADYIAQTYSNSAGIFDATGTATTTLQGKYIRITDDSCGTVTESSASGDIDLGGATGDHACTVPSGHSIGDTASRRTATYELNKIAEMGRGWLPGNNWLKGLPAAQLVKVNTMVDINRCNAFYNPDTGYLSFGAGGTFAVQACCGQTQCQGCFDCGQDCCSECMKSCRTLGENASILDHEWGHALDGNDATSDCINFPGDPIHCKLSNTSEAYADIAAMYRTQTSCSGYGYRDLDDANNQGCGLTSDGTGYNTNLGQLTSHCLTDCSGLRDADYSKHSPNTADTPQNFVCTSCATPSPGERVGPCGREEHCETAPITQAAWDLVKPGGDLRSAPFNYDSVTAFNIANRLFYQGSGLVDTWYSCNNCTGTIDGCAAGSGYKQWLMADDDNGNPSDGTPHMTAIYNAFNRHNIACSTPTVQNSGCSGAPTAAPAPGVIAGSLSTSLSWKAVTGASKYFVFRTEGQAGCNMGRALIATPTATFITDTSVADGRRYFYTVQAVGSSDTCTGPASPCYCANVFNGSAPPDIVANSDYQTTWGTIESGNYVSTQTSNDVNENLKEGLVSGISKLRKDWKFINVPDGCLSFYFEGNRTSSDGDNFKFEWAPDVGGAPGTFSDIPGAVIDKAFDTPGGMTVSFTGPGTGSTIYIRIEDTNQVSGATKDTVKVDRIAIVSR